MKRAKILVADHEEESLSSLEGSLKAAGYETRTVRTGKAALAAVKKFQPDLCVIDTLLPGMDGFAVTQKITADHPEITVIMTTSVYKGEHYQRDAITKYGAKAYLEKPVKRGIVLDTIAGFISPASHTGRQLLPPMNDELEETVREFQLSDSSLSERNISASLANDLGQMLESAFGDIDLDTTDKPPEASHQQLNSVFSSSPLPLLDPAFQEDSALTMRVDADDIKREMESLRHGMSNSSSRVRITRPEDAEEDGQADGFALTSSDIFGALIDDIESGKVKDVKGDGSQAKRKPRGRTSRRKKVETEPTKPQPTGKPLKPETASAFATQPVPMEKREQLARKTTVKAEALPTQPQKAERAGVGTGSNEYQLLNKIASGGMAEVWKAKLIGEKGFEKIVAIKKILPHLSDNEEFITMFIDEAKVAANLTHPNIAQIYELGKMGESFFIAMEYVSGHNLRFILNQCRNLNICLPHEAVVFIGMKMCNALHYAHNKKGYDNKQLNIVHRDVSPQNVLISNEGEVKLVDFGIAKASIKASQTVAGSLKGKLLYMSPEQAEGKALDCRSDIFSLGSVLFEALTGRKLFSGDSELSILKQVRQANFSPPREVNSTIPPKLERLILKALTKDRDERYPSAKAMEHEFKEYLKQEKIHFNESDLGDYQKLLSSGDLEALRELSTPPAKEAPKPVAKAAPPESIPEPEPQPSSSNKTMIWALGGVLFLLVLAAAYFFFSRSQPTTAKITRPLPQLIQWTASVSPPVGLLGNSVSLIPTLSRGIEVSTKNLFGPKNRTIASPFLGPLSSFKVE